MLGNTDHLAVLQVSPYLVIMFDETCGASNIRRVGFFAFTDKTLDNDVRSLNAWKLFRVDWNRAQCHHDL